MAYTSTITLCVQPIGQMVYGFLFDSFSDAIYLCLIPTGVIVCAVGLSARGFFRNMEKEQQEVSAWSRKNGYYVQYVETRRG